uniref:CUB domain-containing protein n=1 Tax=Syphacia muris TaxID=451379 RepID=A0A0N5AUQ2_9BILA
MCSEHDLSIVRAEIGFVEKLWGTNEDFIRSDKPFFKSDKQLTIAAGRKEGTGSSRNHSGFRAILKTYNISEGDQCGGEHTINDTFFITSTNYGDSVADNTECVWNLNSEQKLRVVVVDFAIDETVDSFQLVSSGKNPVEIRGDKSFETPLAYYFNNQVAIHFRSGVLNDTSAKRRFSLIIDPLNDGESLSVCNGVGEYDMSVSSSVAIASTYYGSRSYDNNLMCNFSFVNPPRNSFIYIELTTEIETCCDGILLNGIGTDWELIGERSPGIYTADTDTSVTMFFHTDGVRTASGFTGIVRTQDCTCNDGVIDVIDDGIIRLTSPGYSETLDSAYCSSLNCNWQINFFLNYTLEVELSFLKLRTRTTDKIVFTNFKNDTLQTLSSNANTDTEAKILTVSGGLLNINFITANHSAFYYKTAEIPKGFKMTITPKPIPYKLDEYHELTESNPMQPFSINTNSGDTLLYTVKSLRNRSITLYVYKLPEYSEIVLDIFDGPNIRAPLLSINDFITDNTSTYSLSRIRSSGDSLTFRYYNPSTEKKRTFAGLFTDLIDSEYEDHCPYPFIVQFDKSMLYEFKTEYDDFNKTENATATSDTDDYSCYMVLHSNNPNKFKNDDDFDIRNGMLLDSVLNSTDDDLKLYQGATNFHKYLLTSKIPMPSFIFGSYASLMYNASSPPLYVSAEKRLLLEDEVLSVVENSSSGFLFSPDFLSSTNLGQLHQRYVLKVYDKPLHKMVFQVHNPVFGSQIVFQSVINGQIGETLTVENGVNRYEICGTEVTVTYRTNGGINKGMFLEYSFG